MAILCSLAPAIGASLRLHWYVSGAVPATPTVIVAFHPMRPIVAAGWLVIDAAIAALVTASVAAADMPEPEEFIATARNW